MKWSPFRLIRNARLRRMTGEGTTNYLDEMAAKLGLKGLAPSDLHEKLPPVRGLRHGPTKSRLGGRVVKDLKHLSPDEFAKRAEESEDFLKREPVDYPADEAVNREP